MLEVQLQEFRRVMAENIKKKGQKIVFIHGKGEGVLRNALLKELKKYPHCTAQDASFREYGFGATQITIH
jgi:dsDNA-specific endonuclease/ATPase MutS2